MNRDSTMSWPLLFALLVIFVAIVALAVTMVALVNS